MELFHSLTHVISTKKMLLFMSIYAKLEVCHIVVEIENSFYMIILNKSIAALRGEHFS